MVEKGNEIKLQKKQLQGNGEEEIVSVFHVMRSVFYGK